MKFLFLYPNAWPLFGPMYISSVLKDNGHECEFIAYGKEKNLVNSIKKASPDIIGFYVHTLDFHDIIQTIKTIKNELEIPIILGGPHPTFYPEIIKDKNIDIICRGEGELAVLELLNKMEAGQNIDRIKNLWVKKGNRIFKNSLRPLIQDLDKLPFADRELYYDKYTFLKKYPLKSFLSSRGCPFSCTYCFNHILKKMYENKGRYVRQRTVENLIQEIKLVKEKYRLKYVRFTDDIFILNRKWFDNFATEYKKEIDIPYSCNVRLDMINEDIIKKLKNSGCSGVSFGIETGNERLANVLKRNINNEQIVKAGRLIKKHKLKLLSCNMVGLPGETPENFLETIELNLRIRPDTIHIAPLIVHSVDELSKYCIEHETISDKLPDCAVPLFEASEYSRELRNLVTIFYISINYPFLYSRFKPVLMKIVAKMPTRSKSILNNMFFLMGENKFYGMSLWDIIYIVRHQMPDFK